MIIHSICYIRFWSLNKKRTSIPLVCEQSPPRIRIHLVLLGKLFFVLVLSKVALSLGYLLMDELQRAVAQFYPSMSGGGFTQPPAPSGDSSFYAIPSQNENQDQPETSEGPGRARRDYMLQLQQDKSLTLSFQNACITQEKISLVMKEEQGIRITKKIYAKVSIFI